MIRIDHLDHLVLTVVSIEQSGDFYARVLGMGVETFGEGRKALAFGNQKINLHRAGHESSPRPNGRRRARPTCASSAPLRWMTSSLT